MATKNIHFFGDPDELSEKIKGFCEVLEEAKFHLAPCSEDNILQSFSKHLCHIAFIDFTKKSKEETISLCHITHFLKTKRLFKSTLFVAILPNTDDSKLDDLMISSGFQYIHIKGSDTDIFLTDLSYIAFDSELAMPSFARARNIDLDLDMHAICSLHEIDSTNVVIETDIPLAENEKAAISLDLFGAPSTFLMDTLEPTDARNLFHFEYNYRLELPIEQPWEEPEVHTIQKETMESWLENHQEKFSQTAFKIMLFTEDCSLVTSLYDKFSEYLSIEGHFDSEEVYRVIEAQMPAIIFVSLKEPNVKKPQKKVQGGDDVSEFVENEEDLDTHESVNKLEVIFETIKSIGGTYLPIIFISNSASTAQAISKFYSYQSIIATEGDLSSELLCNLVQKYIDAKKIQTFEPKFKFQDLTRLSTLSFHVMVTSLTEHDITFTCDKELPMFTCLKLDLPIEGYITVIPSYLELTPYQDKYHYQAFIHGLSEKSQDKLRSLIYQICHRPLKEFSQESIASALKRDFYYNENFQNKNSDPPVNALLAPKEKNADNNNEDDIYKRPVISGRSKL